MTETAKTAIEGFIYAYKSLYNAKGGDKIRREARLLDIRFRLTLDLRTIIETEYSSTATKVVHDTYELLFKFLDLWNVYELCRSYGESLGAYGSGGNKYSHWDTEFLERTGLMDFLKKSADGYKTACLHSQTELERYREYLSHFSTLNAINDKNKNAYQKYLSESPETFDYTQLLFIQYMERNAYYHGGEAAAAGTDYGYRKKQLSFFIDFLTECIARFGTALFKKELDKE